jgi:hypothetical protein
MTKALGAITLALLTMNCGGAVTQEGEGDTAAAALVAGSCGPPLSSANGFQGTVGYTYYAYLGNGTAQCPVTNAIYANYSYWSNGGTVTSPFTNLGGIGIAHPIVTADPKTGAARFFVLGTDHAVWTRTFTTGWTSLGGWCMVLPDSANGANHAQAGIDVQWVNGDYRIGVIGGDRRFYYRTLSGPAGIYTMLDGVCASAPSINIVYSDPDDPLGTASFNFFVMGGDGGSYLRSLTVPWTRYFTYGCSINGAQELLYVPYSTGSMIQFSDVQSKLVSSNGATSTFVRYTPTNAINETDTIPNSMMSGAPTGTLTRKMSAYWGGGTTVSSCTRQGS